jgi:hypothetical protein
MHKFLKGATTFSDPAGASDEEDDDDLQVSNQPETIEPAQGVPAAPSDAAGADTTAVIRAAAVSPVATPAAAGMNAHTCFGIRNTCYGR